MSIPAQLALLLIRAYKVVISPVLTGSCRFEPTCSDYMAEAICRHGAARGFWFGLLRIGRCHPFGSAGYDPVPLGSDRSRPGTPAGQTRGAAWGAGGIPTSEPVRGGRSPAGQ